MTSSFKSYLPAIVAAINGRRSVRNYLPEPLSDTVRGQLTEFIDRIDLPFPHEVRVAIVPQDANGSIFYFPSPGNYVTFTCPRTILDQAKLGFAGELFILFA
ncbi:MAG: hypothetical protein GYA24_04890, partial [Candidatus Lokiarchaeota archaeon]|nr:hypothetical protein [Candidatus Lokiarchaeota archaeon]